MPTMTDQNPSTTEKAQSCGHPNHGNADHDCKPFLPCADPACPCGPKAEKADAAPTLVSTPVSHIVTFWQPGSHDWTWADEYADLIGDPVTERVRERVNSEGIAFADDYAPVMLGSDGLVWDGHHRIVLAIEQRIPSLMVEVVTPPAGGAS
jgi:hypothetical protein